MLGGESAAMEDVDQKIDIEKPILRHQANEARYGEMIHDMVAKMIAVGWSDYLEEAISRVLCGELESKIEQCHGIFNRPLMVKAEEWLEQVMVGWLQWVYYRKDDMVGMWRRKLMLYLRQAYARVRNNEMLEIIGEYPETSFCIADIKHCLENTSQYNEFAKNVRSQISKRLLIPGIVTPLIIDQYIQTIRVMKLLDPSALLLGIADRINPT